MTLLACEIASFGGLLAYAVAAIFIGALIGFLMGGDRG